MHLPLSLGQVFNILHANRMKADCPLPSPSKQLDGAPSASLRRSSTDAASRVLRSART